MRLGIAQMKNKYLRVISKGNTSLMVDVYDILKAFNVTCPATQHAIKKLLMPGMRGHKDTTADLTEALVSIERAIEMAKDSSNSSGFGFVPTFAGAVAWCEARKYKEDGNEQL